MPEIREGQMSPAEQAEFDAAATGNRERPFLPDSATEVLTDKTARILEFKAPGTNKSPEVSSEEVSDAVQKFTSDLEHAKNHAARVAILSEVIGNKKLTPNEQQSIVQKLQHLEAA